MATKQKLGELLIAHNIITDEQLQHGLKEQKKTGEKIGQTLIALGYITEKQFLDFFSKQLNITFYDLKTFSINPELVSLIPESFARANHCIMLKEEGGSYVVGMADPLDLMVTDKLRQFLKKPVIFALINKTDAERVFNLIYRNTKKIAQFAHALAEEVNKSGANASGGLAEAPVISFLNSLFEDAVQMGASDVHIEPNQKSVRIRLRIDGVLHEQVINESNIMPAIVSKLKLMSGLNISEKRLPQDGRFEMQILNQKFDMRLSTLPTSFGESVVMRILSQAQGVSDLSRAGMEGAMLKKMHDIIRKPNGIILVTGPTGSGKSTTLYAVMNEINRPEIKIITIEDPIEYFLPWAVQIQTNEKIGLDFATILRGILRHDPDVILVGEMRDKETSTIAMRTALTGRLVLSTLHTNDSLSAVFRLTDLGIEPFMIASTTQAILAQRLIRLICQNCIEDHTATESEKIWLAKLNLTDSGKFKHGKGCSFCANTGFHGRRAVFELLEFNEAMSEALRKNDQDKFHKEAAERLKGNLLANDAFRLAEKGLTTISEMIRLTNEGF